MKICSLINQITYSIKLELTKKKYFIHLSIRQKIERNS